MFRGYYIHLAFLVFYSTHTHTHVFDLTVEQKAFCFHFIDPSFAIRKCIRSCTYKTKTMEAK